MTGLAHVRRRVLFYSALFPDCSNGGLAGGSWFVLTAEVCAGWGATIQVVATTSLKTCYLHYLPTI